MAVGDVAKQLDGFLATTLRPSAMKNRLPGTPQSVVKASASTAKTGMASDKPLALASLYLIPALAVAMVVWALLSWAPVYEFSGVEPVKFKVLRDDSGRLSESVALERLAKMPQVSEQETKLSEKPFWISLTADVSATGVDPVIVFPSRHVSQMSCWNAASLELLGEVGPGQSSGNLSHAMGGYRLDGAKGDVLCRTEFVGPARISVQRWDSENIGTAQKKFERNSGLIDGGVGILAVFALMVAIVYRDPLNVLFAAWLIANMRTAALSAGWDTHFVEHAIPAEWLPTVRAVSIAAFYTLTAAVFRRMFKEELKLVPGQWALRYVEWSAIPLLVGAFLLPYRTFLPTLWLASAAGVLVMGYLCYRVLKLARSWMAICYALSLAVILVSSIYEVAAAALGFRGALGSINSITAAVVSSLMAAIAIAEHMRREHQGRLDAQAELQHTYDVSPVGLFTLASDGRFLKTNPALVAMLGDSVETDDGVFWGNHFQPGSWQMLRQAMRTSDAAEVELSGLPGVGGRIQRFLIKAAMANGRIEGSLQDITERHQATEKLRHLSEFDALTEVLNRRGIDAIAATALSRCSPERPLALAYLDMDRFKLINDLFGHSVGDDVLKQICERLAGQIKHYRLGRVGGDEFLIVMEDANIGQARLVCQRIVDSISGRQFESGGKGFKVGVSIGLVEFLGSESLKDVIAMADRACRLAKSSGSGVHVFEAGSAALRDHTREMGLIGRFGVDRPPEGLFLEMQPILSLRAPTESLNFEMLLRMREPDGSIVSAGTIVTAAENSGRIALIDRWVLKTTLEWLERNKDRLGKTRFVSMNLSGASLSDEVFVRDAFEMLSNAPAARDRLCLEVTESVALRDTGSTRLFLEKARRAGIRVALDDFGAGYTSFSYLKELPADALKIDGSFVRDAAQHPASLTIIEAIAKLASNFGMQSIAEWAEDLPTLEALVLAGIDHVQGYVVSRPVGEAELLEADSVVDLIRDPKVAAFVRGLGAMPKNAPLPVEQDYPQWTVH